ncbi:dipeptidase [Flavobacteriaceae bacterium]|jgi:microsomal dipeptidase-like Zn-dependent dipeptidase|nr:dipeptidase [Flavobacteriaceae bacterium]MDC1343562.1 dipeptidase [Flavobacteriaceae bacterium]|tara:strand:+ start:1721 stop:3031 length:1311 start_codon:yes stop_codon:yes gene_type:complete
MKIFKVIVFALLIASCNNKQEPTNNLMNYSDEILEKAQAIHDRVLVLDTHVDISVTNFTADKNYTEDLGNQVNLPTMEAGGLDVAWFIVYTGQGALTPEGYDKAYENAISKFDAIHRLTKEIAPERIGLAVSSAEAKELHASGKKIAMIGVENAYPLGTDISRVKEFYDRGARYMSLSHNGHSQFCDSNTGEKDSLWVDKGVSDLGKLVIKEMNKWGIMIDVSHPSKQSIKDMINLSKAPIIASHSSARALCNHSRNLDDEQLEWMKSNGGVVQTVAFSSYVSTEKHSAHAAALSEKVTALAKERGLEMKSWDEIRKLEATERDRYMKTYRAMSEEAASMMSDEDPKPVDVADYVDHIDYLVKKMGLDHVGISSDFDGGGGIYGWNDASETLNVTAELVKRGYTEAQIAQLWSGNLLRVLDDVAAIAKELQAADKV